MSLTPRRLLLLLPMALVLGVGTGCAQVGVAAPAGTAAPVRTAAQAQRMSLRTTTARLTSGGAKVVFVKTDRPGQGMATRCTPAACTPLLKRLITQDELRVTWNKILDEEAALNPKMTVIALDDVYCKDAAEPCNDRLPDGTFARPDGTHFSKAYMPFVAKVLAARIASAVAS